MTYRKIVVPPPLESPAIYRLTFYGATGTCTVVESSDLLPILKRIAEEYSMGHPRFVLQVGNDA